MTRIYFATNRNVKHETSKNAKNFGDRFNLQGPQCFRVGRVDVALTGDPEDDEAWEVGRCELFPETLDSSMEQGAKLGSAAMFEEIDQRPWPPDVQHRPGCVHGTQAAPQDFAVDPVLVGAGHHLGDRN